jgi:hypothetical protein
MFKKILIANRGDRMPEGLAAAQPHCMAHAVRAGDFAAGAHHV